MIYVVIQTIQLLGRRVILKIVGLASALVFSGIFQVIPLMLVLPIIRIIARPNKQGGGLPRKMKALFPEDLANNLDQLIVTTETKTLILYVVSLALILFGIQALMTKYIKRYLTDFLDRQHTILANKLFNNYLAADIFSYSNPISRIQSGCQSLTSMLDNTINLLYCVVMSFILSVLLIFIYPLPGAATVIVIMTSVSVSAFVIQPKMDLLTRDAKIKLNKGAYALSESMNAIKEIKLMGRERFFFNIYLQGQKGRQNYNLLIAKFQTISTVINIVVRYLGLAAGMVVAMYALPKEELAGFFMLFMLLSMRVYAYAQQIIARTSTVYKSLLMLQTHYKTLLKYDKSSTVFEGELIVSKESVEFKNVYFRHEKTGDDNEDYEVEAVEQEEKEEKETLLPFVLEDLNCKIKQGEFVGIVGRNGSGKSTMLDLFSGLIVPTQGCVLIDGKKLELSDRKNWRRQINYVIQKPHIISQSILYNVTLGLSEEEVDHELLDNALQLSMLDQVIEQLPEGLETNVGIRGTKISGGQAQRIALARALYQDRPILLLDEATRAIDAATENEIMEKIASLRNRKTIIIVTHRVQSLRQCDRIFVIEDKKIVSEGDYETLCKDSEIFRLFALGDTKTKKPEKIPSVA